MLLYQYNSQMGKLKNERIIFPSPENKFSVTILLKVKPQTADYLGMILQTTDFYLRVPGMFCSPMMKTRAWSQKGPGAG